MKNAKCLFLLLFGFIILFLAFLNMPARAETCSDKANLNDRISCYESEVSRLSEQSKTLSNQIAQFDAQIRLTTLKISQTEEKISLLGGRIDQLEVSLDALTKAFSVRAKETYKLVRLGNAFFLLLTSSDLSDVVSRFHYLQKIQEADTSLLERLQTAQTLYKGEKTDQEKLQIELELQKKNLDNQKVAKAALLGVTQNDEKKYQQLLAEARAELAAINGLGKETFLRNVSEGEKIGTLISGKSGCSTGTHLHFEVHNGDTLQDPNNYLRMISTTYNYGPDQYGFYGTINPHGSWNWPMDEPVRVNQGFGSTGYGKIAGYAGGVHTGIDMESTSSGNVKAVRAGKMYGGAYQCGGNLAGTLLYAKIEHGDGITTWYLHMTPQ